MKRTLFTILFAISVISFSNCGMPQNSTDKKDKVASKAGNPCDFVNEHRHQIFSPPYIYDTVQMIQGVDSFQSHYFLNTGGGYSPLKSIDYKISINNLITLLHAIPAGAGNYETSEHLSALNFIYGMDASYKMVLILEPVYLIPKSKANSSTLDSTADVNRTGKFYYTDENGNWNRLADSQDMKMLRDRYQKYVGIIHNGDKTPQPFNNGTDVISCIMTLQEINKVYCDFKNSISNGDSINFQLVADTLKSKDYKLHIVAYYGVTFEKMHIPISFKGYAADFSELCPTNCNTITSIHLN